MRKIARRSIYPSCVRDSTKDHRIPICTEIWSDQRTPTQVANIPSTKQDLHLVPVTAPLSRRLSWKVSCRLNYLRYPHLHTEAVSPKYRTSVIRALENINLTVISYNLVIITLFKRFCSHQSVSMCFVDSCFGSILS